MTDVLNWKDSYDNTASRIVLTSRELQIPGLRSFGWQRDVSASWPLPNHFHENLLELTFIAEGNYTFRIGGADYPLKGGELFIAYPNEIHSTNQLAMSVGEFYWLQLDPGCPDDFLFLSQKAAAFLQKQLLFGGRHVLSVNRKEIFGLLARAFSCAREGWEANRYLCASFLVMILNLVSRKPPDELPSFTPDIEAALHYIHSNIREELSLETIAAQTGLSLSQFKLKFRQQTGSPPRVYINRLKIELSKEMLLAGKTKTEIAMELGFSTSSYFTSVFRKYTACTPSEFLRKQSGETAAEHTEP